MTREDASRVIRIICAAYPNTYPSDEVLMDAISVWSVVFAADISELVESAVYTYINEERFKAPNPGQIRAIMQRITHPDELSEGDAWNLVQRALNNGLYGAQEEFDRLPEDVQKAIGSPQWIHAVASDEDANMSVESSNFYRRYRQVMADKREKECMPSAVRKMVEQLADSKGMSEAQMLEDKRTASAFEYEERRQKTIEAFLNPQEETISSKTITSIEMLKERLNADGRFNDQNA